eukprot:762420-Hanusia_phi.AAC.1
MAHDPLTRPRDEVFNGLTSNNDFDYLGTIENNILTLYSDYRGSTYQIDLDIWLNRYQQEDTITGTSLIVQESYKSYIRPFNDTDVLVNVLFS